MDRPRSPVGVGWVDVSCACNAPHAALCSARNPQRPPLSRQPIWLLWDLITWMKLLVWGHVWVGSSIQQQSQPAASLPAWEAGC